jgi:hypothetical protein
MYFSVSEFVVILATTAALMFSLLYRDSRSKGRRR